MEGGWRHRCEVVNLWDEPITAEWKGGSLEDIFLCRRLCRVPVLPISPGSVGSQPPGDSGNVAVGIQRNGCGIGIAPPRWLASRSRGA